MASAKHIELLKLLYDKTIRGEIEWTESGTEGIFQVSFSNYSVLINSEGSPADYSLSIVNDNGDVVDRFSDTDFTKEQYDNGWYLKFEALYETARRTALGAEDALNSILDELKSPF